MPPSADDRPLELRIGAVAYERHVYEAVSRASGNAHEVLDVLLAAGNRDAASDGLMLRFGFDEVQAAVVLDMQFGQLTREKRAEIQGRLHELDSGVSPPEADELRD